MVRRIIWTQQAVSVFNQILEFYYLRNGSKTYSFNLNREIQESIALLKRHPFIGRKTDKENVRILIKANYKIFYRVSKTEIIILMVWDTHQDPETLKF